MTTLAAIQARIASTRLPGKVMMPLAGVPLVERVVHRVDRADEVDETVVATSERDPHDVVASVAEAAGAKVYRGSEQDVLGRLHGAAIEHGADTVVRICADSPLVSASILDPAVRLLRRESHDYVSNKLRRTFPLGMDVEAFTMQAFDTVEDRSADPHEREHVTVYFRDNPDEFSRGNLSADAVFEDPALHDRSELRVTLDEPADYSLLRQVFCAHESGAPTPQEAIRFIDRHGLADVNRDVQQKSMYDVE